MRNFLYLLVLIFLSVSTVNALPLRCTGTWSCALSCFQSYPGHSYWWCQSNGSGHNGAVYNVAASAYIDEVAYSNYKIYRVSRSSYDYIIYLCYGAGLRKSDVDSVSKPYSGVGFDITFSGNHSQCSYK